MPCRKHEMQAEEERRVGVGFDAARQVVGRATPLVVSKATDEWKPDYSTPHPTVEAMKRMREHEVLGPLQTMWDVWSEVQDLNMQFDTTHYWDLITDQIIEITTHLREGHPEKAKNEMVDIISIAMNWLRRMGVSTPQELADCIEARVKERYVGKVREIVERDLGR
jgi:hypothetical protein